MAFDIQTTCETFQTALKATNLFSGVDIARPTSPVKGGPYAALAPVSMRVASTTLVSAIEVHTVKIRLHYAPFLQNEQSRVLLASQITSRVMDALYTDFAVGGAIRNIDVAGQYGTGIEVEFIDEEFADAVSHVSDITVPLIVDSATAFVA